MKHILCNETWMQTRFRGSRNDESVVGRSHAADRGPGVASYRVIFRSFLALSFLLLVTPAVADRPSDSNVNSFLFLAMLKLGIQAAACDGHTSIDTPLISRKLQDYVNVRYGLPLTEAIDKKAKEYRAGLSALPATESERNCKDALSKSIEEYSAMRDAFLSRKLDQGFPPPLLERATVGLP